MDLLLLLGHGAKKRSTMKRARREDAYSEDIRVVCDHSKHSRRQEIPFSGCARI